MGVGTVRALAASSVTVESTVHDVQQRGSWVTCGLAQAERVYGTIREQPSEFDVGWAGL